MEEEKNPLKLYSDVESVPVDWLWYPYIPYGKITILQGDPGDGKSTLIMNVISALTTAGFMPDGTKIEKASGFKWIDDFEIADPHYEIERPERHASQEIAVELLKKLLSSGPVKAVDVRWYFGKHNVSMRTANRAKKTAGVKSIRKDGQWYWVLESGDDGK